jgi:hypothetical protein
MSSEMAAALSPAVPLGSVGCSDSESFEVKEHRLRRRAAAGSGSNLTYADARARDRPS